MWMSEVEMNVWIRGRSESLIAPQAASMSALWVRASPQITGPSTDAGDRLDRLEVARRSDREARLDHVDPQPRELVGDLDLLLRVERDPGRLLAVSQRRVKDVDLVGHWAFSFYVNRMNLAISRLSRRPALFPPEGEEKEKREAVEPVGHPESAG